MGSVFSKGRTDDIPQLLFETQIFASWTLDDVRELYRGFQQQVFGFSLVEVQFESIMAFKSNLTSSISFEDLFAIIDNDNDGRIDGLEFLGGLILCCDASFEDKCRFCFEVFDFNLNASLSRNETAMMIFSCICGINLLTGGRENMEPDLDAVESIVEEAFSKSDVNLDGCLSFEEFISWARSNRNLMAEVEKLNRITLEAKFDIESEESADEGVEYTGYSTARVKSLEFSSTSAQVSSDFKSDVYRYKQQLMKSSPIDWKSSVIEPTNMKYSTDGEDSRMNLSLSWSFGYNCDISKNSVRYVRSRDNRDSMYVLYPSACLGVVYDTATTQQSFYHGHETLITSVAIHPNDTIVATGDISGRMNIWNALLKSTSLSVNTLLKDGIKTLVFSPSGNHIACVGFDADHTVIIYNCINGELMALSKGIPSPNTVNAIAYSNNGTELAIIGNKGQMKVLENVSIGKKSLTCHNVKIGSMGKKHDFLSICYVRDNPVCGTASGELYRFKAGKLVEVISAHNEPILSMHYNKDEDILTTGSLDGAVKTWDVSLKEIGTSVDIANFIETNPQITAAVRGIYATSVQQLGSSLLIGTKGGDIFDVDVPNYRKGGKAKVITSSHYNRKINCLAIDPSKDEFVTCGDDQTIRLWSLKDNQLIRIRSMPAIGMTVAYNSVGNVLALGMDDGSLSLMDMSSFTVYSSWKLCSNMITCGRFSPDDKILGFGSVDGNIYLYRSEDQRIYMKQAVCRGHSAAIVTLDISKDSQYIQSNGSDYSLFFWDMKGNQLRDQSITRDIDWSSHSCSYTWALRGALDLVSNENRSIKNENNSFDGITFCSTLSMPEVGDTIIGFSDGSLRLFGYPVRSTGSLFKKYFGHAGGVNSIQVTTNRRHILTISSNDNVILVWNHFAEVVDDINNENRTINTVQNPSSLNLIDNVLIPIATERDDIQDAISKRLSSDEISNRAKSSKLSSSSESLNAWRTIILPPSNINGRDSVQCETTDVDFELSWVHGYRWNDCRNSVKYSTTGNIIMITSSLIISYHKTTKKQKFLQGLHHDEILSMSSTANLQVFATGDAGRQPVINIWNSSDFTIRGHIETNHVRGVILVSFDRTGQYLASVGQDDHSTLRIYDWIKNIELADIPLSRRKIYCLCYVTIETINLPTGQPKDKRGLKATSRMKDSIYLSDTVITDVIITGGEGHLRLQWTLGRNIVTQNALWDREPKGIITSIASASQNVFLTGSIDGKLLLWNIFQIDRNISKSPAYPHKDAITTILPIPGKIISAAVDADIHEILRNEYNHLAKYIVADIVGMVSIWLLLKNSADERFDLVCGKVFNIRSINAKLHDPAIQSLAERDGIILISTRGSEIYEVNEASIPFVIENESRNSSSKSKAVSKLLPKPSEHSILSQRIIAGHSAEVWGLTMHPSLPLFMTTSDDSTLRCWSLEDHRLLSFIRLPQKSRAIDIIPTDSAVVAVGFNNGEILIIETVTILNPHSKPQAYDRTLSGEEIMIDDSIDIDISQETNANSSKNISKRKKFLLSKGPSEWIQEIKYSFNGWYLIAASHDRNLYIYNVASDYELSAVCVGHSAVITHFDIGVNLKSSSDSKSNLLIREEIDEQNKSIMTIEIPSDRLNNMNHRDKIMKNRRDIRTEDMCIQSSSENGELFYWRMDGNQIRMTSLLRDAWWSTWSVPYGTEQALIVIALLTNLTVGWPVQGIWPTVPDGVRICALARSHSWNVVPVIATGDDHGRLRLYRYPSLSPGAPDKCYYGHKGQITKIKFSYDDNYCVSIGSVDHNIFVWKTDILDEITELQANSLHVSNPSKPLIDPINDNDLNLIPVKFQPSKGDQFMAVKPWKGSIQEPSNFKDPGNLGEIPEEELQLKYVYGYRGWDCRNNIAYTESKDRFVYHTAGVGIVLDSTANIQIHNTEHDDDIISLAIDPDGHVVATGEIGKSPKIVLWDMNTGTTIRVIKYHQRGVSHVKFSYAGDMLISIGMDDDRSIAIHNVKTGKLTSKGKVGRGVDVYSMAVNQDNSFCTVGKNHVKFWSYSETFNSSELSSKTGVYSNKQITVRTAISVIYYGGDCLTGMVDGSLITWKDRHASKVICAHSSAVTAICHVKIGKSGVIDVDDGPCLITGGKDGFIHIWNSRLEKLWSIDMNKSTPQSLCPIIQALTVKENNLLIGTKGGEIYEINLLANSTMHRLVVGHYETPAEAWGLDTHPSLQRFVTCCDDMTVRVWDSKLNIQLACVKINVKARVVAYSVDGSLVSVGCCDGKLKIYNDDLSDAIVDKVISSSSIVRLEYSPNGRYLALGANDGTIYLLDTSSYNCQGKCIGHHSSITGIDWAMDSSILQSCSRDYEILYWTFQGSPVKSLRLVRDVSWASSTCVLGWSVQGIWPIGADGTDVNSVDRSPDGRLVVSGDDFRMVKLFKHPCPNEKSQYRSYKGHSEHVTRVKFSKDGRYVVSVGGLDKAIFQFQLKKAIQ